MTASQGGEIAGVGNGREETITILNTHLVVLAFSNSLNLFCLNFKGKRHLLMNHFMGVSQLLSINCTPALVPSTALPITVCVPSWDFPSIKLQSPWKPAWLSGAGTASQPPDLPWKLLSLRDSLTLGSFLGLSFLQRPAQTSCLASTTPALSFCSPPHSQMLGLLHPGRTPAKSASPTHLSFRDQS